MPCVPNEQGDQGPEGQGAGRQNEGRSRYHRLGLATHLNDRTRPDSRAAVTRAQWSCARSPTGKSTSTVSST
jgi:hypothetical protein